MGKAISGFCAVITNPNGDVVTTNADFERTGYGGMSLEDAQEHRARNVVKLRFARDHLNDWLASKADGYFCDQLWKVAELAGYKMQVFPVKDGEETR